MLSHPPLWACGQVTKLSKTFFPICALTLFQGLAVSCGKYLAFGRYRGTGCQYCSHTIPYQEIVYIACYDYFAHNFSTYIRCLMIFNLSLFFY